MTKVTTTQINFLHEAYGNIAADASKHDEIELDNLWWYGDGSGWSYDDTLVAKVLPFVLGRAEVVYIWEGGDSVSGYIVEDGKVTQCDVEYKLTPKKAHECKRAPYTTRCGYCGKRVS